MFERSLKEYSTALADQISMLLGCEVVRSNITNHIPAYPYVSYTITTVQTRGGTYGDDGKHRFILARVTYSFTVQSDDDWQAFELAQKLHDWVEESGRHWLNDHGYVITEVGSISSRDNLITIEYEYRKGFDCVLNLMNYIEPTDEVIESFEPKQI